MAGSALYAIINSVSVLSVIDLPMRIFFMFAWLAELEAHALLSTQACPAVNSTQAGWTLIPA